MTPTDFDTAYDYIVIHKASNDFLMNLFEQFQRKGSLSEKQVLAVLNIIQRQASKQTVTNPVKEVGMYRNDDGVYRVKLSSSGNLYAMRFDPTGETKADRFVYERGAIKVLTADDRMTLDDVVAMGVQFGQCCVCGAELTDEKSVQRGIGPTCAKKV